VSNSLNPGIDAQDLVTSNLLAQNLVNCFEIIQQYVCN